MTHIGLFEGIGGFSLAARWMGWETIAWCEINPFCQTVLKHHFPNAHPHSDIKQTDFTIYRGKCDVLTGGFPCQPYSTAGKRLGKEDERHLWPEMLRAIREIEPTWVVGENVRGIISWNGGMVFDEVQADLEAIGYEVIPFILPACGVNAPHRRDRVWFIAYSEINGNHRTSGESGREIGRSYGKQVEQSAERGGIRIVTNANDPGTGIGMQHIRNWEEIDNGWERQPQSECGTDGNNGTLTNPQNIRCRETKETERERGEYFKYNGAEIRGSFNESCGCGTSANTESEQSERMRSEQSEFSEQGKGEFRGINSEMDGERFSTDTTCIGRNENDWIANGKSNEYDENSTPRAWHNFPTQSPVCSRNDGLPNGLDGITFSKWRNESIKAYGNAVVPQIPYRIFKAIEQVSNDLPPKP